MYSNFKEQAMEYVKHAVQEDNAGNYVKAFPLYMNALEYFKTHLKYEKNPKIKEAITQKFTEYLRRAQEIRVVLDDGGTGPAANGDAAVATRPKTKAKGGDGGEDPEQAKLRAGLTSAIISEKPNVKWNDVAGLESAKQALQEAVILPVKFPQFFTVVQDPTEGAESGGSDAEITNSPKQDQGDKPPSIGQAPSKEIIGDVAPAPTPVQSDSANTNTGLATLSKQRQGPRNIPRMVLGLQDEVISSIKSLNYDNYQSIINKVKESNSLLEPFGIGLTLEPFMGRIAQCAAYAKEASEDPNVQAYLRNQQAKAYVHEKVLAFERLNKSREGWADDINRDKEELQRLGEEHQKLQDKLCEIQDAMKTLSEKIETSTSFLEASESIQMDLQTELDKAKAQVIEDQGDHSDVNLMAIFTKWLDELEEAKESLMKSVGH